MIAVTEIMGLDKITLETICRLYRKDALKYPSLKTILELEKEAAEAKADVVNKPVIEKPVAVESRPKPVKRIRKKREVPPVNMNNYKYPLVRVTNIDGKLLRYEDAEGQKVPVALWPVFSSQ